MVLSFLYFSIHGGRETWVPTLSLPLIGRVPGRTLVISRLQFLRLSGEQPLRALSAPDHGLKVAS